MPTREVPIEFHKVPGGRYHSVLHRADGVSVRLQGGGYNRIGGEPERVPHDIAHLVVEDALGVDRGLWGVLAAGGLLQGAEVVAGRQPPHALRRSREITDPAGETLRQAEILVRAVADSMLDGTTGDTAGFRARVGERWWTPAATAEALERAATGLREVARRWDAVPYGSTLELTWTETHSARGRRRR